MSSVLKQAVVQRKSKLEKAPDSNRDPADLDIPENPWEKGDDKGTLPPPAAPSAPKAASPEPEQSDDVTEEPPATSPAPKGTPPERSDGGKPTPEPPVTLPSSEAPPAEIITIASRIIYDAVVRFEDGQRKLTDRLFEEAGPAVRLVHTTKSFKEIQDPETSKPYRSFRKWAADQGILKSNAYRMVNEIPVSEALKPVYTGTLPSGHIDVLAPVLRQHGAESVREVWSTAEAGAKAARNGGRPTVVDLMKARQILGLGIAPEADEPEAVEDPARTFKSVQKALRILADTGAIRIAMRYNPQETKELLRQALEAGSGDELELAHADSD